MLLREQAFLYQLIESTLKLGLNTKDSVRCINFLIEVLPEYNNKKITTKQYYRYVKQIKKMSPLHKNLIDKSKNKNWNKSNLNTQLEKILFNYYDLNKYNNTDIIVKLPAYKTVLLSHNTDDLVNRALIHLNILI